MLKKIFNYFKSKKLITVFGELDAKAYLKHTLSHRRLYKSMIKTVRGQGAKYIEFICHTPGSIDPLESDSACITIRCDVDLGQAWSDTLPGPMIYYLVSLTPNLDSPDDEILSKIKPYLKKDIIIGWNIDSVEMDKALEKYDPNTEMDSNYLSEILNLKG